MPRIVGIDLPENKKINIALTYIYGIGLKKSNNILKTLEVNTNIKCKDLNDKQINSIREIITSQCEVEGDLRRVESNHIRRLMEINSYRGKRHKLNLPLRGQRTRTNARTRRGTKKTIAGKKKAPKK
uniref:Ribosomal protein S13 n=1 Tax=Hildenbrandia rivularis TaxID=135206 RepID=A0A1C9CFT2_9FLOR|nr:ribosomal protein S13 [Hildenbrandia rivularis]AOM67225.1 ribosomal protein S13 [Hildenbrandia rivularis]